MNAPGDRQPAAAAGSGLAESLAARAVELAGVGVWHRVLGQDHVDCNEQMFHILGLPPGPGGLSALRVRSMLHPEDLGRAEAMNREAVQSGRPVESQLRYVHADGRVLQLLSRRSVLRDAAGRPHALLGVTLDVTERHEQALRASEGVRRIALMARAAGIGWWSLEGEPPRITWSAELRRMVGLAPNAPVPPPRAWIDSFVHPDDREALRQRLRHWRQEGRTSLDFTFRLLAPDGSVRDIVSHAVFEPHGAGQERFGMLIDVTERRQAARELHEARERTALAVGGAGIGIWEWHSDERPARWDENMFRLRGLAPGPVAPSHEERMAMVHPDDRELVERMSRHAITLHEPLSYEFRIVRPDGQVRWLASRSVELPDLATGGRRRIGANWDVTDRRQAEQARRDAEVALRESQAKSRFLARMSHELRTPLNAVLGFAQLLQAQPPERTAADTSRRQALEHIQRAGAHLLTLINEVLDLARIEAGEMDFERAPVSLAALAEQTVPLVAPQAQVAGLRLEIGSLDFQVLGDGTRLRQVLLNLLGNAVKYNRPGGEVHVDAVAGNAFVHLRVRDTGRGIATARLGELFQPFNRLGAEHETIEGTGIGLAIVKSLVEHMGGHVQVSSTPGVGSLFEVVLPRAPAQGAPEGAAVAPSPHAAMGTTTPATGSPPSRAAPSAPAAPATPEMPAQASAAASREHRVLYIEDNEVNALIVQEILATVPGYRLAIAPDGGRGLQMAQAEPPDIVLLDMQLPDMDGFEVLRRLRQQPATAALPVVALSANVMPEQVSRGLAAGLADYWTKPLDLAEFVRNLTRLLPPPAA